MKIDTERKLYSLKEIYWIVYDGMRFAPYVAKLKKKDLSPEFIERIMLAVTEVNGCLICSYAHTKMALETGMSNEEIRNMLSGVTSDVPSEELQAILFAQHYADFRGKPTREAWNQIVKNYGLSKAKGILGAIRIIMMGNAYGIPWSSFINRWKKKPDARSNVRYELAVILLGSILIPFAMLHALLSSLLSEDRLN